MSTLSDELDLILQARNDIQDALAEKGQVVGKDIRSYAQAVSQITTSEDLEAELSEQEQLIHDLEVALYNKTAGADLELNIYVQTTEPTEKNGIWLQTDKPYSSIDFVTDIYGESFWDKASSVQLRLPPITASDVTYDGNDTVYLKGDNKTSFYKWTISTDTYEKLPDTPTNTEYASIAVVGDFVYFFGGATRQFGSNNVYKYNINTQEFIQLTNLPYTFQGFGRAKVVGTDIYLMGDMNFNSSQQIRNTKWDTLTDTYRVMTYIPYRTDDSTFAVIGTEIYIIGGGSYNGNTRKFYKYDTLTDTYYNLGDLPMDVSNCCAISIGTTIYIFRAKYNASTNYYSVTKYDTVKNEFSALNDCDYEIRGRGVCVDNKIYFYINYAGNTRVLVFKVVNQEFFDKSIIISQGIPKYSTILINNNAVIDLKYNFNDAFVYTAQDGLITNIPTYYGDGTQWVKFKN